MQDLKARLALRAQLLCQHLQMQADGDTYRAISLRQMGTHTEQSILKLESDDSLLLLTRISCVLLCSAGRHETGAPADTSVPNSRLACWFDHLSIWSWVIKFQSIRAVHS